MNNSCTAVVEAPFALRPPGKLHDRRGASGSACCSDVDAAAVHLSQPKLDLFDIGQLKLPNSGKPEFGREVCKLRSRIIINVIEICRSPSTHKYGPASVAQCRLRVESDLLAAGQRNDAMCQLRTYAPQQNDVPHTVIVALS